MRIQRLILVTTLLLACVGCDQVTKVAARSYLREAPAISYLADMVRLTYAENSGAFLSAGASLSKPVRAVVFQGAVGVVVIGLLAAALFWRGLSGMQIAGLTLLGASGLGNLIDRVLYDGRVTDFLNVGIGPVRTGIFNVADIAGVIGVVVLLVFRNGAAKSGGDRRRAGSPQQRY